MARTYILLLFAFFFYHLHLTGNITKYINMKYAYISYIAIILFAVLMLVEGYFSLKKSDDESNQEHECGCSHDLHQEKSKPFYKRWLIYGIFLFPIFTGIFLPVATLDSTIVKSKGFSFKSIEANDAYAQTQYLKPDTSLYYGQDGYEEMMEKELKNYVSKKSIILNEKNYLKGMETIYKYPGDFLGKKVEFDGFTFKGDTVNNHQLFVLRFGIIHCIADSGVYGMLVEFPKKTNLKDDEWVHVKGKLSSIYYQPFKANIPYLIIEDWKSINEPKEPYVYRGS